MARIFITGGSGFIGTNLVEYFINHNHNVINYDINKPRNKKQNEFWIEGDILNYDKLNASIKDFQPEYVVHLAARTDLNENKNIIGYNANIEGVENIVKIINTCNFIKRTIYASSRMVCKIDYVPNSFHDYCPPNLYGESKMIGEEKVRQFANHQYTILRPTSIWGPWFEIPYRTFFDSVKNNHFFLPKKKYPKKSFGFVYNTVFQIDKILFEKNFNSLQENYYLTDYPALDLKEWSDLISTEFKNGKTKEIPLFILKIIAFFGDVLKKMGYKNPPLTTFRLNNLITNMVYDTQELENVCGKLPYDLNTAVKITSDWVKQN
jgi:nucleoside-diphosphate-sugar epimerase